MLGGVGSIKTALVHDWILPGGALEVFKELIQKKIDEDSPDNSYKIFTLISYEDTLQLANGTTIPIVTTLPKYLNKIFHYFSFHKIFLLSFIFDYRNLMFFYPLLMKRLSKKIRKFGAKDIVISSFAIAKNIEIIPDSKTLLYLHSPMQYIRSHHNDYLIKLSGLKRTLFKYITRKLRKRDLRYTSYDKVLANSHYTAQLAKEIYDIDAEVQYPHINELFYHISINTSPSNYYVYLGRLTKLVREADTVIKLFNTLKLPLFVMGSGPDERELKTMAGDTIVFLGWINNTQEKIDILKNAKGLINITKESFGLNTVEALLLGVPVFGLNDGASPELIDTDSGILIDKKNFDHIDQRFLEFIHHPRDRKKISQNIKKKLKLV